MATESEQIDLVVQVLKGLPAKRLRIIELANEVPIVNGHPDTRFLEEHAEDIEAAATEAKAYGGATLQATSALMFVKAISER